MSEGIRFRRESAPFNLVLAMSKGTELKTETENQYQWKLDLPKNLSVEDFVGKFVQVIFDKDAIALASFTITCAITNVMAMTLSTGVSSSSNITATAKFTAPFNTGDINLSILYRADNGKTMATISTPATGDGT